MNSALDTMCLQSQINISSITRACVVLVQYIIQALIEVLQVEKDDCSASLHTDLDSIDVPTNLYVFAHFYPMLVWVRFANTCTIICPHTTEHDETDPCSDLLISGYAKSNSLILWSTKYPCLYFVVSPRNRFLASL